jgi:AcrR family transcriptional regulator
MVKQASRRREPEDRRDQLIHAALETLGESGIESFTLAEVARRAKVSAALIVHYFGDKDRLLEAAFRLLVERVTTLPMQALAASSDPEARLRAFVRAHLGPTERPAAAGSRSGGRRFTGPNWRGCSGSIRNASFPTCATICAVWWRRRKSPALPRQSPR